MPAIVANSEDTLAPFSLSLWLWINFPQGSNVIREIACIEYLDTSIVLPVKRSHGAKGACLLRVIWVVEPQTQVVMLDRISRGIRRSIRTIPGGPGSEDERSG